MLAAKFAPQLRQIAHHVSQALSEEHHVGSYNGVHLRLEEDVRGHVDSQATHSSPLSTPCVTAGSASRTRSDTRGLSVCLGAWRYADGDAGVTGLTACRL